MLENKNLFEAVDPLKSAYDDRIHLAHITALLGEPPQDLLARGKRTPMFYDAEGKSSSRKVKNAMSYSFTRDTGNPKGSDATPHNFSFESSISKIGGEDKRMFLEFVSRMLKWRPEDRSTAKDLLNDPWLRAVF